MKLQTLETVKCTHYDPNKKHGRKPRWGLRARCRECGWSRKIGGVRTLTQMRRIYNSVIKEHQHDDIEIVKDFHAAEIGHSFVAMTTRRTITGTTWTDVSGAALADTEFTNGDKYLIVVHCVEEIGSSLRDHHVRVDHGGTVFDGSEQGDRTNSSPREINYLFFVEWTAVASENIQLQQRYSGSGTGAVILATIFAIHVEELGASDYFYDENGTNTALTTSWSTSNNASVTFTPNGTDDFLAMTNADYTEANTTQGMQSRLNISGGVTSSVPEVRQEIANLGQHSFHTCMRVYSPTNTSTTIREQSRNPSGSAHTRLTSRVVVINMNAFEDHTFSYTASEQTENNSSNSWSTSPTLLREISQTLSSTPHDVWFLAYWLTDPNTGNDSPFSWRLQIANDATPTWADDPTGQTADDYDHTRLADGLDQVDCHFQTVSNHDSSNPSRARLQWITAVTTNQLQDRLLMGMSLELAAGVTNFTRTATQTITESDVVTRIQGHIRTAAQTITESDVVVRVTGKARIASQTITESDAVVRVQEHIRAPAQTITESDVVDRGASTFQRTAAQTITESDVIVAVKGLVRTAVQTITESDVVIRLVEFSRTVAQIITESDVVARIQGHVRTAAQTITESDSVVAVKGTGAFERTASQTITESDTVVRLVEFSRTVTQTITELDVVARITAFSRTATQTITESDSVTKIQAHIRSVAQSITESDIVTRLGVFTRTASQVITHSEIVVAVQAGILQNLGTAFTSLIKRSAFSKLLKRSTTTS